MDGWLTNSIYGPGPIRYEGRARVSGRLMGGAGSYEESGKRRVWLKPIRGYTRWRGGLRVT